MSEAADGYQVLARKYRPSTFSDLVGQDAMVRTLRNAFAADRIAQAFMLTGIRGTGKTTTARILAKGMNCLSADGPTIAPCGTCSACTRIAGGRHVDVIEMDAASNTQVEVIRANVLDSVAYAPAECRFKVFIIDEVHMLSTSSFNALLKTLEEPPAHVKFIFATTEVRKVPVTVLSRCQRFDLRRIEPETMLALLRRLADAEGAVIDDTALKLLVRAAEGSARDATSLLDQAISHGDGAADAEAVRAMLGLADRARTLDLFDLIMAGDAAGALAELGALYANGADPVAVLRDLAEIAHGLSVAKVTDAATEDLTLPADLRARSGEMAAALSQRVLGRAWQMLLKALEEVGTAPNAMMAAEMAVIRMTHVADLPPPEELLRALAGSETSGSGPAGGPAESRGPGRPSAALSLVPAGAPTGTRAADAPAARPDTCEPSAVRGPTAEVAPAVAAVARDRPGIATATALSNPAPAAVATTVTPPASGPRLVTAPPPATAGASADAAVAALEQVAEIARQNRDLKLLIEIETGLRPVAGGPGRLIAAATEAAAPDLAQRLQARLRSWTGTAWDVAIEMRGGGGPTLAERHAARTQALRAAAENHPAVAALLALAPAAKIAAVRSAGDLSRDAAAAAQAAAAPHADGAAADPDAAAAGGWDPLDDTDDTDD